MKTYNRVLTIAGSDSGGGAGIQADIKTMTVNGVYAMSAITAMTAQNTENVRAIAESSPDFLQAQLDAVFEDIYPNAVKIGMVSSSDLIRVIAETLKAFQTVGAIINRPHSTILRFCPSSGEFATLCCRAATSRPYIPTRR